MSGIKLQKKVRLNLNKEFDNLERVRFELRWEVDTRKLELAKANKKFDADAQAFICKHVSRNGSMVPQLLSNEYMVYFNSEDRSCPENAVTLSEDEQDAGGEGETIVIDLPRVNKQAQEIALTVSIHKAASRNQNFGQLSGGGVDVYNDVTNEKIATFSFGSDEFSNETFLHVGSLFHSERDGWEFDLFNRGTANMDLGQAVLHFGGTLD